MTQTFALALTFVFTLIATPGWAQSPVTTADFAGTWNIDVASHQVALVIEVTDETHVTATMMMMGRDLPLNGTLAGRTLTLVGIKAPGTPAGGAAAEARLHAGAPDATPSAPPKPITVSLEEDGTLSGEMMTTQGPTTWTGKRLKTRKG
jgi:hypothetical protein